GRPRGSRGRRGAPRDFCRIKRMRLDRLEPRAIRVAALRATRGVLNGPSPALSPAGLPRTLIRGLAPDLIRGLAPDLIRGRGGAFDVGKNKTAGAQWPTVTLPNHRTRARVKYFFSK